MSLFYFFSNYYDAECMTAPEVQNIRIKEYIHFKVIVLHVVSMGASSLHFSMLVVSTLQFNPVKD